MGIIVRSNYILFRFILAYIFYGQKNNTYKRFYYVLGHWTSEQKLWLYLQLSYAKFHREHGSPSFSVFFYALVNT